MEKTFEEYCNQHGYKYDIHWRVEKDEWGYCKGAQMCKLHIMFLGEKCEEKDARIEELESRLIVTNERIIEQEDHIAKLYKTNELDNIDLAKYEDERRRAIDILENFQQGSMLDRIHSALEILRGGKK